jgi:hypothetical protein
MTWIAAASRAGFAGVVMMRMPSLVHAVGVEPTATRLSAGALAVRTSVRRWCVLQVLPLPPLPCQSSALLMS